MKIKITTKVFLLMFASLGLFNIKSSATTFTVTVANFMFSPSNIPNVIVGDTIKWVWLNGSHTTTCDPVAQVGTTLPAGAATWSSPMNAGSPTFLYKVTVAGIYNYWCIPHSPGMAASFTASEPLPIKLSTFKIANENNSAVLNWTTASEENINYFSIQKSKTGSDFTEIGRVPAAGNSSITRSYHYTDRTFSSADKYYYYMLAIVDKEGKKEFSSVQLYRLKASAAKLIISLSPNPVGSSGHLMLKFNAEKTGNMDVRVISTDGKTVIQTSMLALEGVNNGHIMLGGISPGVYSIVFKLNNTKEVHELIIK